MYKVEDLIIWKKSIELTKRAYLLISEFPSNEKYRLNTQIKRSAVSIPSNIAEGAGINSNKKFKYFMSVANSSTYELETQLILLIELNLISKEKTQPVIELCIEI
ncbi:four helix bundle protein [uncultured Formosa sp.]|uniref:four helix bundle protein n=1 Tax=uncultured Formosa sp. TaxID=255435 RepID=UPI0026209949|nr:four helix bundle protein [uncultured Formosa sp.]